MANIQEIHENILNLLLDIHEKEPEFRFTMRERNNSKRLEKGFWFNGNDQYLAFSFWTGRDWKNKTPNIYIDINKDKRVLFIFSAKDNEDKRKFAMNTVKPALSRYFEEKKIDIVSEGTDKVLIFNLGTGDYIKIVKEFINDIKKIIDELVEAKNDYQAYLQNMEEIKARDDIMGLTEVIYQDEGDSPIDFIWPETFINNIKRINHYREFRSNKTDQADEYFFKEITISKVGDIRNKLTIKIPESASWIFLTGENGCGKSTVLRAITSIFYKDVKEAKKDFFNNSTIKFKKHDRLNFNDIGFAAYGPSRLITSNCKDVDSFPKDKEPWYHIFHPDGMLRNLDELPDIIGYGKDLYLEVIDSLDYLFNYSEKDSDQVQKDDAIGELIPQLGLIDFSELVSNGIIKYIEKDSRNNTYNSPRNFEELASGVRSLVAMISDIVLSIVEQNREQVETTNYKGVILIDEIDIHFHPKMQKQIVEILSAWFPKVQFIVSTHSPVTLLGAPENSVFYKVERSVEKGIIARRLEHVETNLKNMLPNVILTSDLFDMDEIIANSNKDIDDLIIEDDYKKIENKRQLDKELNILKSQDNEFYKSLINNKSDEKSN
jgi:predicted ATPase